MFLVSLFAPVFRGKDPPGDRCGRRLSPTPCAMHMDIFHLRHASITTSWCGKTSAWEVLSAGKDGLEVRAILENLFPLH